jgi:hypothetical protein
MGPGQIFSLKQLVPPEHSGAWPQAGADAQPGLLPEAGRAEVIGRSGASEPVAVPLGDSWAVAGATRVGEAAEARARGAGRLSPVTAAGGLDA